MPALNPGLPLDYAANGMFQLGYVFADISGPLDHYVQIMGSSSFVQLKDARLLDQTYCGCPLEIRQNIAFGFVGSLNVELIEPLEGVSCYSTFLAAHPNGGLHHFGCKVSDFDRATGDLEMSGFGMAQAGRFGSGTRFAYFDTRVALGHYLDVLFFDQATETLFNDLKKGRGFGATVKWRPGVRWRASRAAGRTVRPFRFRPPPSRAQ